MSWSLADIDALLAADKSLVGGLEWVEEGSLAKLSSPVVDAHGHVIGGLLFRASVQTESPAQRGSMALIFENSPIQRLNYRPSNSHRNKGAYPIPAALRFLTLPGERSRIYRWSANRIWPMVDNMGAGELVEPEPPSYISAVELFLEACRIRAYLPEPPHRPRLEFDR